MLDLTKKQLVILSLCFFIIIMLCVKYSKNTNNKKTNYLENGHKPLIINFNADWCYFSKKLQPTWNTLTEDMKNKNINVLDIKCELDKNKEICNKYEIQAFPTIKLIVNNNIIDYDGDMSLDDLYKFINKNIKI